MIQYILKDFLWAWRNFEAEYDRWRQVVDRSGGSSISAHPLGPNEIQGIITTVSRLKLHCEKVELSESLALIDHFETHLDGEICTPQTINVQMQTIHTAMISEMGQRLFVFIPPAQAIFYDREDLFGAEVSKAFPSVIPEIKNAGNSMAADLHDAAVFHLMRAVGIGLRTLARKFGINQIGEKTLEFCDDGAVIKEAEKKITEILKSTSGAAHDVKWDAENSFYRTVLLDLNFFKDVVRNPTFHGRKDHTQSGALNVLNHVRDFLQRTAKFLL